MSRHCANAQSVVVPFDIGEIIQAIQIYDGLNRGHAQVEQRHKTLPTGQYFGLITTRLKQSQGFVNRAGTRIFEWCGFHIFQLTGFRYQSKQK